MAEAAISKSLDQLIAESRSNDKKPRDGGSRTKVGGRGDRNGSEGRHKSASLRGHAGGVDKPRRSEGRQHPRAQLHAESLSTLDDPESRRKALEGEARWTHDKFRGRPQERWRSGDLNAPSALGTKLILSNLHYDVSEEDLRELFSSCGEVARVKVVFDASGRSLGSAWVVMPSGEEAKKAQKSFQGVALDGQAMQIELVAPRLAGSKPLRQTLGERVLKSGVVAIVGQRADDAAGSERPRLGGKARGRGSVRQMTADSMQE